MSNHLCDIRRQVDELEALKSIYDCSDILSIEVSRDVEEVLSASRSDDDSYLCKLNVPLTIAACFQVPAKLLFEDIQTTEDLSVDTAGNKVVNPNSAVKLFITLPKNYPSSEFPLLRFDGSRYVPPSEAALLTIRLTACIHALQPNEECIFQIISQTEEFVRNIFTAQIAEAARLEQMLQVSKHDYDDDDEYADEYADQFECPNYTQKSGVLGRRVFYSHHIRSAVKRDLIMKWGLALQLTGVSRIGHPGIIIVEGPEESCSHYANLLQRLRWKHFVCRGEQTVKCAAGQTVDDLRVLPRGFLEIGPGGNSMAQLSSICREAGLSKLLLASMKIYR